MVKFSCPILPQPTPLPSPLKGEKLFAPFTKHGLGNSPTLSSRKEIKPMLFPFGRVPVRVKGQTVSPIDHHHLG
jgi:hypothetical protein